MTTQLAERPAGTTPTLRRPEEHLEPWRFKEGNPGRPKGSRNKLGEAFLEALHDDFKAHGIAAVQKVRDEQPAQYLKVIASILPKEMSFSFNDHDEMTDEQLFERVRALQAVVAAFLVDGDGDAGGAPCGETIEAVAT